MMLTPERLADLKFIAGGVPMVSSSTLRDALAHIDAQQARIDELEQDAARYRWILHQAWFQEAFDRFDPDDRGMQDRFEKCVAEIADAAMQK